MVCESGVKNTFFSLLLRVLVAFVGVCFGAGVEAGVDIGFDLVVGIGNVVGVLSLGWCGADLSR